MKKLHRTVIQVLSLIFGIVALGCSSPSGSATVRRQGQDTIVIALSNEHLDLTTDPEKDLSLKEKNVLQITVPDNPVRWFIDGTELIGETGSIITLAAVDYPVGIHHVTALAYRGGIPYSDELTFKVVE